MLGFVAQIWMVKSKFGHILLQGEKRNSKTEERGHPPAGGGKQKDDPTETRETTEATG